MASSSNYSLLFSSSIPTSKLSILSSMIHSRRQQPVVLKEKSGGLLGFSDLKQQKGFGCSIHLLQRNSSIRRRCNKGWGSEGEGDFALETEILKFMDCSENPDKFPTKKDLINAGRGDLLEAIEKNGEFLSKNWDLDLEKHSDDELFEKIKRKRNIRILLHLSFCFSEKKEKASVEEDDTGNNGILKRLEKETDIADDLSCKNDYYDEEHKGSGSGVSDLPALMLEFLNLSENPNKFPTKKDLIKAGRVDLVESINKDGKWLSKNWDIKKEDYNDDSIFEKTKRDIAIRTLILFLYIFMEEKAKGHVEGRLKQLEERYMSFGIYGILKRYEKERNLSFGLGSREQETDIIADDLSCKNDYYDDELKLDSLMVSDSKPASTTSLKDSYIDSEATDFGKGSISDFDNTRDTLKPDTWRAWSSQREGLSQLDFEAAEIGLDVATDNIVVQKNVNETEEEGSPYVQTDQNWFRSRAQHLELELASTLRSLKSASETASEIDISSLKGSDNPSDEFFDFSDAWELKETEVMNAKNKLRSIRAKLTILEGKVALASVDSHKNLEMKQKRINASQLGLTTLRNACIVWPNNKALVVLVCGSFDGWTSQRMMERSESGFFILNLKLYPGRYEFKFIVDGVWKIDPSGPIASNNGYENNVLVVS